MSFLAPAALSLLVLLPIIVAMYLLRLRREEHFVASVYLWHRMVREMEANAPWQRLRRNFLMYLQLLVLLLMIMALARPFSWREGSAGQTVVVIMDTTASMGATDAKPNRLEAAKDQARQLINDLPEDARVTLIATGAQAEVAAAATRDRGMVLRAIDDLRLSFSNGELTPALQLANAITAGKPDANVIVYSDGNAALSDEVEVSGHLQYFPIGLEDNNQAISLLTLSPEPGGQSLIGFCQISNFSGDKVQRRLEIRLDGWLVQAYDLEIEPFDQAAVIIPDIPIGNRILEGTLVGNDVLQADNQAWAVFNGFENREILLITEGNMFLETALALLPGYDVVRISPDDLGGLSDFGNPALTIFDGVTPITTTVPADGSASVPDLPSGNLLFIGPENNYGPYVDVRGIVEFPVLIPGDTSNPPAELTLKNIILDDVQVFDSVFFNVPDWAYAVILGQVVSDGQVVELPLMYLGELNGQKVGAVGFDFRHTDLPLRVTFPLLISNMINWYQPAGSSGFGDQVLPGSAVSVSMPLGVGSLSITRPDGEILNLEPQTDRVMFGETDLLGVYEVQIDELEKKYFSVNLFSPTESNLKPALTLDVRGQDEILEDEQAQQRFRKEWWPLIAGAALVFLVAEWLVYYRGNLSAIFSRLRLSQRSVFLKKN